MNSFRRRIATMLILTFMALALLACDNVTVPAPGTIVTPQPVFADAQATLDYGQSQMEELSYQATVVNLDMNQAANAMAQTTLDYNQSRLMELSIRATEVSQNMARAAATQQAIAEQTQMAMNATATVQSQAATQQFIAEQTQMAWNATATSQSQAATATYSAYILNVTQTAQAQAVLDTRATETAQAVAALTAIPLTATPLAATQAAILFQQRKYERQSAWGELVTPLMIILTTLVILLLIMGGVLAFRRFMPVFEFRLLNPRGNDNTSPLVLMDGTIVDIDPHHHQLTPSEPAQAYLSQIYPSDEPAAQVEIFSSSEPSVARWIAEAEQELHANGRIQP
jgi:hypothetical protein